MKKIIFIMSLLVASSTRANEALESDLAARIRAVEKAKDMALVDAVFKWEDMPTKECMALSNEFQLMVAVGIERITYEEIYPVILSEIKNGITLDGVRYEPNVKPYKMIQITYKDGIKNGSSGFSTLVGERDGKLWVSGYRKIKR